MNAYFTGTLWRSTWALFLKFTDFGDTRQVALETGDLRRPFLGRSGPGKRRETTRPKLGLPFIELIAGQAQFAGDRRRRLAPALSQLHGFTLKLRRELLA